MKAKEEGRHAFMDGNDHNPYPAGTTKRTYWQEGFNNERKRSILTLADWQGVACRLAKPVN